MAPKRPSAPRPVARGASRTRPGKPAPSAPPGPTPDPEPTALKGAAILGGAYLLGVLTFLGAGFDGLSAVFLGGSYALSAVAALLFSRGVLELFLGVDRPIVFFTVLRRLTGPLMALMAPLTPGFLLPFAAAMYHAFLFYLLKTFLFGDAVLGAPPLFILLWIALTAT